MASAPAHDQQAWLAVQAAWAEGGRQGRELDRRRWRGMTPAERIAEAQDIIRIAGKLSPELRRR